MAQPMSAQGVIDSKAKPRTSSRVSSALKSGVVYGGSAVLTAVSNITPHIAGAVDILVVEQPDGSRKASPFYVRFGKYTALRTGERNVKLSVNGKPAPFGMHIGMYGQAYFATAEAAEGDDDEQEALLAGVMSPPSGYSSGAEGEAAETGETLTAVRRRINGIKAARAASSGAAGNGARGRHHGRDARDSVAHGGGSPRVSFPVPALGTESVQRLGTAETAGAVAEEGAANGVHAGELVQALHAQLAPALSANDRNESFLSAHETLAGPLGDDIVAAAVAAGASPSLLASPDIQTRQPPPPPQQHQPKRPGARGGLQVAAGSSDSLLAESEGVSPCGWSEEDEEEEQEAGQRLYVAPAPAPHSYGGLGLGPAVEACRLGAAAPAGAAAPGAYGSTGAAAHSGEMDHIPSGSVSAPGAEGALPVPESTRPLPALQHTSHIGAASCYQHAVPAPLHQQLGFPENSPTPAVLGYGAGTDLECAPCVPHDSAPRLQPTVDWAQVLGSGTSGPAHAVASPTPAMPIAAAAGRPGAAHAGRHRASPAGGCLSAAAAADGPTHGSGSHHAVSLLSSSLKCGSNGGDACGSVDALRCAALPGLAPPSGGDGPFSAAEAGLAASADGRCRGPGDRVALAVSEAGDGGVRVRLHVVPGPAPAARLGGAATPFGPAAAGVARPLNTVTSCASEGGYLGDTERSSSAAAARPHRHASDHQPINHHHAHHPISHHHSHHVHYTHAHSHSSHHPHHGHLHSTSAPLPASAIDAAAAAEASGRATATGVAAPAPPAEASSQPSGPGLQLSLCGSRLTAQMPYASACALFEAHRLSEEAFLTHGSALLASPELVVRLRNGAIYPWHVLSHGLVGLLAFGVWRLPPNAACWAPEGAAPCDAASAAALLASAAHGAGAAAASAAGGAACGGGPDGLVGVCGGSATTTPKKGGTGSVGSWLWPFRRERSSITGGGGGGGGGGGRAAGAMSGRSPPMGSPLTERQVSLDRSGKSSGAAPSAQAVLTRRQSSGLVPAETGADGAVGGPAPGAGAAAVGSETRRQGSGFTATKKSMTPTPEQLAALDLKHGQNTITYRIGGSELKAYVYYLHWRTKIVISDIDGTITKSDVLGHLLPAMGLDWSHPGIAELLTNIRSNNYQIMYLSSRSISQANITRDFINTLVQGQHRMPLGPVIISPHGLLPSLYREMILRRPHDFKIETLLDIRALFPPSWNPFYGGFGNRDTDEISYREVGVQPTHIFIINPRGELRQPVCHDADEEEDDDGSGSLRGAPADVETGLEPSGGLTSGAGGLEAAGGSAGPTRPPAVSRSASATAGRGRGAAGRGTPLSSLSAINQLVHDIFPPLRGVGFGSSSSSSSLPASGSGAASGAPSAVPSVDGEAEAEGAEAEAEGRAKREISAVLERPKVELSVTQHVGGLLGDEIGNGCEAGAGAMGSAAGEGGVAAKHGRAHAGGPAAAVTPQRVASPRRALGEPASCDRALPGLDDQDETADLAVVVGPGAAGVVKSGGDGDVGLGSPRTLPCAAGAGAVVDAAMGPAAALEGVAATAVSQSA